MHGYQMIIVSTKYSFLFIKFFVFFKIIRWFRAQRARTSTSSTSVAEKRSKPPSVGDSEGLSESEPTPTRATRSRSSTTTNTPAPVEPTPSSSQSQISTVSNVDDEEQKNLRKTIFSMYEKLVGSEAATSILKSIQEDQSLTSKWYRSQI